MDTQGHDLLYGTAAIARHLGLTVRQAKHRCAKGAIPTFKMGRTVCARRSSIIRALDKEEERARNAKSNRPRGDGRDPLSAPRFEQERNSV
jgi:hypothetical protein